MVGETRAFRQWLRHRVIAFDTSFLISLLEDRGGREGRVSRLFRLIEKKSSSIITSTITLLEVLVHPYRRRDIDAVNTYYGYLAHSPTVRLVSVTPEIADRAAEFRARYGFKTPDAIQLATAVVSGATLFLARDFGFRKQQEIEVGILR